MDETAVIRIRLDPGNLQQGSQQAAASLKTIGDAGVTSARQTAAAMRALPAQFTDVATQLAGGGNPLLVLLQQGGQVRDMFGGFREAAAGVASAIGPLGAVAAIVGVAATAAYQGARGAEELRDALAISGNAAGLTGARLEAMAATIEAASQQTIGASRQIVLELARSGQVSASVLDSMGQAVARVADVAGQDAAKVAADFATMQRGVADWAAEHNKAWNFITVEQYKYIRRLEEQGEAERAAIFVNEKVLEALAQQQQNLGTLESAWNAVAKAASTAWNAMLAEGRTDLASQLTRAQEAVERQRRSEGIPVLQWLFGTTEERQAEVATINRDLIRQTERAMEQSAQALQNRAAIAAEREREKSKPRRGATGRERLDPAVDFSVLDAREGAMRIAQAREAEASNFLAFVAEQEARQQAANDARLTQQANFLQQLADANARASVELIADERERGEALIRLDRDIAQRRLTEQGLGGDARSEALRLLDEQALIRRRALERDLERSADDLAARAGAETYQDVREALAAAFRDSSKPAQAFASALGNAIFTRVTSRMADALATAAVGSDGRGGLLGDLLGFIGSIQGGGMTVDTGGYGINNTGTSLPTRGGMATGTNFVPRDMLALVHRGEAIVPAKYNPAAGGRGGQQIVFAPVNQIDARADIAQVQQVVEQGNRASMQALIEMMRADGRY